MHGHDPTGDRPGASAPVAPGAGADTVLAALAHRLRARSDRQQLLTERLRSGELRPGALADLAELAAAARRGIRDGDHILVMAGAAVPDRGGAAAGPTPLGQALSSAVATSEAASRTVVPPTPSVSLVATAAPVFGQILAELLAHATAATSPGERLELHTRWAPDGGLVLELLSPRPVPTRMPVEELDRMLAAGRPEGAVAPQEIGLFLAARLARALGGRLGVRGAGSVSGPSPVAVLQLPPSVFGGSRPTGERVDGRAAATDTGAADADSLPGLLRAAEPPTAEPPTGVFAATSGPTSGPGPVVPSPVPPGPVVSDLLGSDPAASDIALPDPAVLDHLAPGGGASDPEPSIPPWPPVPAAESGPSNGVVPDVASSSPGSDRPDGRSGPARLPVPPAPGQWSPPMPPPPPAQTPSPPQAPPPGQTPPPGSISSAGHPAVGLPPAAGAPLRPGPGVPWMPPGGPPGVGPSGPHGTSRRGPRDPAPRDRDPGSPGVDRPGTGPSDPRQPLNGQAGPGGIGSGGPPARRPDGGPEPSPLDVPSVTEALPVPGTTPPMELFGPFDSEVPVPVDDLDGTPIFAAVASAWFREPSTPAGGAPAGEHPPGTNGHRTVDAPANWRTVGDAEFEAARSRADRVVEPSVNANGLPIRRPGQQLVPPSRRDDPSVTRRPSAADRQPDRVRNRLASYQRGLREGRHRAAEENATTPDDGVNGSAPHGRNGHAAG